MEVLSKKVALFSEVLTLAFKLCLFFGGVILVYYGQTIGHFPKNISISDGFLLTSLAIMFGLIYVFFVVCITSLSLFLEPLWSGLQSVISRGMRWYGKIKNREIHIPSLTFEKGSRHVAIFAFFAALFLIGLVYENPISAFHLLVCMFGCAFTWSLYQQQSRVIFDSATDPTSDKDRITKLKDSQLIILGTMLVVPLFYAGITNILVDGVMRLVHFRIDSAVVHVKQPYVQFAKEHDLRGTGSAFGADFKKFSDVKILLNHIGTDVVVEFLKEGDKSKVLVIPADHIHIITKEAGDDRAR